MEFLVHIGVTWPADGDAAERERRIQAERARARELADAGIIKEIQRKARRVYWLNPEPRGYWDTGDSILAEYATYCDGVYECRNLRQLERFVTTIVEG